MLERVRASRCARPYDLAMLDLDGVVYIGGDGGAGRRRAPGRGPRGRDAAWRSSPTTPPGPRTRSPSTCASSASRPSRATSSPRPRRPRGCWPTGSARAPGWCCSAATGCEEALREEGLEPVGGRRTTPEAVVTGYGPDVLLARHHAGGGAGPRRAALGGQQHRPDHPDGLRRRRRATGCWSRRCRRFTGVRAGGGRQAAAAAARRDGAPGRRRAPADGGRPAGHRHRGRAQRRRRLAAGADRRDRAGRAGGRAGPSCDRRTSRPTWRGLLEAHAAPERAPTATGRAGRLAGATSTTAGCASTATGAPDDWWRVVAAAAWAPPRRRPASPWTRRLDLRGRASRAGVASRHDRGTRRVPRARTRTPSPTTGRRAGADDRACGPGRRGSTPCGRGGWTTGRSSEHVAVFEQRPRAAAARRSSPTASRPSTASRA